MILITRLGSNSVVLSIAIVLIFLHISYVNLIATGIVFNIRASGSHIGLMMAFSEHRRGIISVFDRRSIMNRLYWHTQQVGQGAQPLEKCWNFNPLLEKCWNLDWALKIVQNPGKVLEKWHFSLNLFQNLLATVDTSLICKTLDYMFSYFSVFATSWVRWTRGQIVRFDCTPVCL